MRKTVLTLTFLALLAASASALDGWHQSRDDGLTAARKSGKPTLVITLWKEKV